MNDCWNQVAQYKVTEFNCFCCVGFKVAIKRIVGGKWGPCSGQACIGIDYMLVEEKLAPTVVSIVLSKCLLYIMLRSIVFEMISCPSCFSFRSNC